MTNNEQDEIDYARFFPWEWYANVYTYEESGLVFAIRHGGEHTLSGDPEIEIYRISDLRTSAPKADDDDAWYEIYEVLADMQLPLSCLTERR